MLRNIASHPLMTFKTIKNTSAILLVSGATLLSGCLNTEVTRDPAEANRKSAEMRNQIDSEMQKQIDSSKVLQQEMSQPSTNQKNQ